MGWAYYAIRLLALSRRGAFESSWRNIALGALATATGIALLTAATYVGGSFVGIAGSAMIAIGGAFMFLALVSQYSIWNRMLSSEDSKKVLESFAMRPVGRVVTKTPYQSQSQSQTTGAPGPTISGDGKKTLLEFDPVSGYEGYVAQMIREAISKGSAVALFTKPGSTLSGLKDVRMVFLSYSEQSIRLSQEEGTLWVSITNPSLILDAFATVTKADPGGRVVIDNLTDITLNLGFERAYDLLQRMNDVAGVRSSLFLLLNIKAHSGQVRAAFEGYGNAILRYDADGLHVQKDASL
ncbi:MAG: hypothetical protein JRN09_02470 [Nitrososphaerota archaeon]|nr:hypothetical protein [Nitrososphaerota archaeon]